MTIPRAEFQDELIYPQGTACDGTSLFVADDSDGAVHRLRLSDCRLTGSTQAQLLASPAGVALTEDASALYVADAYQHCIVAFSTRTLDRLLSFGSMGARHGELSFPEGLVIHNKEVIVADCENHRVSAFTLSGAHKRCFGTLGDGPGQMKSPCDVSICCERLVVNDELRLQVCTQLSGSRISRLRHSHPDSDHAPCVPSIQ